MFNSELPMLELLEHEPQSTQLFISMDTLTCPMTGVLDYASQTSRQLLEPIDASLRGKGFSRLHIRVIASKALHEVTTLRQFSNYMDYVREPGDIGVRT